LDWLFVESREKGEVRAGIPERFIARKNKKGFPMVSREDLRRTTMFGQLSDEMLDKIIPITDVLTFNEGEIILNEGERGEHFYILKRGKVLLEKRLSDKMSISVGGVRPGFSFGWSALLGGESRYTLDATSSEPSEVFAIKGEDIRKLLDEDHSMGYLVTQGLLRVVKRRLDNRTERLLKVIAHHPDMGPLLDTD
jgi:CRP-like cAMP-binding protein